MSKTQQEVQIKFSGKVDSSYDKSVSAASQKMSELTKGSKNVSDGFSAAEKSGRSFGSGSADAVSTLDTALAAAGIMTILSGTAEAFMECTEAAAAYETALAKVSTIADPAQTSMESMKSEITALSQETGQSVGDLSESVYQAISASVETADAVEFVSQANQLAVGGFTDTTTAVDVLTTAINAYGLEASDAAEISDMLITTQKLGKTTVGELGSVLGSVIPTAAAYKVNMENVSAAMAEMTKQGINTAAAGTSLRAMLSELAKDGSTVSDVLREETGKSFSTLMSEGKTLGDVLDIIGQSVDGDSTAFANLFSNVKAKQGALAIFNAGAQEFNDTVDEMKDSVGATADAYGKMENTAEHAQKVFSNSVENLKIAIGDKLSPAVSALYEMGAEVLQGVTSFVEEHPEVVAAVTAVAVAAGVFAAALVGYTVAAKAAAVATAALTAVMDTNPIFLAISAVAALALGVAALASAMDDASENGETLTAESRTQRDELDRLNAEYEETAKKYGETSTEALTLKGRINELTTEFETSRRTYADMLADQSKISDSFSKLLEEDKTSELNDQSADAQYLISKLFSLAEQSEITAASQAEMQSAISKLNSEFEGLNLTYDDVISKTGYAKDAVQKYTDEMVKQGKLSNATDQLTNIELLIDKQKAVYDEAKKESDELRKLYDDAVSDPNIMDATPYFVSYNKAMSETIEYTNAAGETVKGTLYEILEESETELGRLETERDRYKKIIEDICGANEDAAASQMTWRDAATEAVQGIQGELDNLAAAYDDAFESAKKSIESTVGLTTELSNETDITAGKLAETWENQIAWIDSYSENLQKAQQYGITDGLIASLSDGSESSGQYINQIIGELDRLNDSDAQALVDKLNEDFEGVQSAESEFAKTVADYKTDFSDTMDELQEKAESAIDAMDLSAEAKENAAKTIQAYISEINAQIAGGSFVTAADAVQSAVSSVLTSHGIHAYALTADVEANAKGTASAANVFLAGEEGPELIVNAGGSQVFTAAETQRILSGEADVDGNRYDFDLAELVKQLSEDAQSTAPTIGEMADSLAGDTYSSAVSGSQIHYSPTYQINAAAGESVADSVKKADKLSRAEFAKLMKEYELETKRTRF